MQYIDICGDIDERLATRVCRQLIELSVYSEPIILFIDTEGGYTCALQKIVKAIIDCGVPVYGYVIGNAFSAGFDLLMFCDRVYANLDTNFLFHWAVLTDKNAQGVSVSFGEPAYAPEEEFDTEVFGLVSERLGLDIDEVRYMARQEKTWTAMQALYAGIVDFIVD